VSSADLEAENRALKQLLKQLTNDAAHNETVMQRFQARELSLLSAQDLPDLIERLTIGLRSSFALEAVNLILIDPYGVLSELLNTLGVDPQQIPHLLIENDMREACARFPNTRQPWLGPWQQKARCKVFPFGFVRSAALLPLRQPDGLAGFLSLGSEDPQRFHAEQGTEFLQRLSHVAAVCLENAVNRERLRLTGLTDGLTGLYNRRHLKKRLQEESNRAIRHQHPLSCLFIDADHFKQVNDKYGHSAGDQVLVALAKRIREQLRGSDLPTRYGGEEIAVLLPQTDASNAQLLAERIRQHIVNTPIPIPDGRHIKVTVSIGVAQMESRADLSALELAQRMLDSADRQVYIAKQDGRDCVRCAS